jgi:hypothetical protein
MGTRGGGLSDFRKWWVGECLRAGAYVGVWSRMWIGKWSQFGIPSLSSYLITLKTLSTNHHSGGLCTLKNLSQGMFRPFSCFFSHTTYSFRADSILPIQEGFTVSPRVQHYYLNSIHRNPSYIRQTTLDEGKLSLKLFLVLAWYPLTSVTA